MIQQLYPAFCSKVEGLAAISITRVWLKEMLEHLVGYSFIKDSSSYFRKCSEPLRATISAKTTIPPKAPEMVLQAILFVMHQQRLENITRHRTPRLQANRTEQGNAVKISPKNIRLRKR